MTSIAGRYTLVAPIGRGSMGDVYEAYDENLHRRVALKQMQDGQLDPTSVRRFRREARLAARINHPGVPVVYDLAEDYLAMEYVEGSSLRDVIAEEAPLPVEWVAAIGLQIAAVLACAHRVSLVHRDLKPSNIMLTRDGAVKVIDFGVAALGADAALSTLTPAGVIVGTAEYQAPERMLGLYSARSDLYSLGCVLRDLGGRAVSLVDDLTAPNPDDRPASAAKVIERLLPLLSSTPPMPTFTRQDADVVAVTGAYLALINSAASVAPHPAPADVRRVRGQVDRLLAADLHSQATALLEAAIAAGENEAVALDLRRDLARVLFDAGDFEQTSMVLRDLVPDLSEHLGDDHAAVLRARSQEAEAVGHAGRPAAALVLYQRLLPDLLRLHGPRSQDAFSCRQSIAVLHAITGQPAVAADQLEALLRDQDSALGPAAQDVAATRQLVGVTRALAHQYISALPRQVVSARAHTYTGSQSSKSC